MSVEKILNECYTIAVVGISSSADKPSHIVASYLAEHGYKVIPVNPNVSKILGKTSYPNLSSIPDKVDVVDIFRRSEDVEPIIEEAIEIGAKAVWMQEGIINEEAAVMARDAGLMVVTDRCMKKEHTRLTEAKA
ncbi:CoA-binding protein [Chloroflexota bacterium]